MSDAGQGVSGAKEGAMSAKQAAAYLDMSESWVWHSDVPRVRLGRRVKFLRADLDAYLRQRRTHGTAARRR
jgi:predicted DNA-binding transcriptional regulator AlpA